MVEDLVPDGPHHLKGGSRRDRVNQHVAMNADKMFGVHNAVIILSASREWCQSGKFLREAALEVSERGYGFVGAYLPGRIHDLGREVLALIFDDATKGILNGWIITINEVAVDELDRQRGFAYSWGVNQYG